MIANITANQEKTLYQSTSLGNPYRIIDQTELDIFYSKLKSEELQALQKIKMKQVAQRFNDKFLIHFIFARKLDVERTEKLLNDHLAWRTKYHIDNMKEEGFEKFLNAKMLEHLTSADHRGTVFIYAGRFDPTLLNNFEKYVQFSWWYIACISDDRLENAREGWNYLEDFQGASLVAMTSISRDNMKELMNGMQNAIPLRIRKVYLVNTPWYLRVLMAMVKPFMNQKLQSKFQVVSLQDIQQ